MGTKFRKLACDEHGIGGRGEYCGGNGSHLGRISVLYHEALGGKYDADTQPSALHAELTDAPLFSCA
jgi:hypothetical protein